MLFRSKLFYFHARCESSGCSIPNPGSLTLTQPGVTPSKEEQRSRAEFLQSNANQKHSCGYREIRQCPTARTGYAATDRKKVSSTSKGQSQLLAQNIFIQYAVRIYDTNRFDQYPEKQFIRFRQRPDNTINSTKAKSTQEQGD